MNNKMPLSSPMLSMVRVSIATLCLAFLLASCGGSNATPTETALVSPSAGENTDLKILFIGNSHTAVFNVPGLVKDLIELDNPNETVLAEKAQNSLFLDEHISNQNTLALFEQHQWDRVVLQAQKYSQSMTQRFSTMAAENWIRKAKSIGAKAILFPEWGQRGRDWEGDYVHDLHLEIAAKEPACVAPIGKAWDIALSLDINLVLHADDGNHANLKGAFLTALVLYQTITGQPADLLPHLSSVDIDQPTQDFLRMVASQAVAENPPCP